MQDELRALSLWRPWPHAMFRAGKNIENRSWPPWEKIIGKYIGLHAGLKYDDLGADWMQREGLYTPPRDEQCPKGCIVGVCRVVGFVIMGGKSKHEENPWFFGPYGWELEDIIEFEEPVPARGAQGLWLVKPNAKQKVREAYKAAKIGRTTNGQ